MFLVFILLSGQTNAILRVYAASSLWLKINFETQWRSSIKAKIALFLVKTLKKTFNFKIFNACNSKYLMLNFPNFYSFLSGKNKYNIFFFFLIFIDHILNYNFECKNSDFF